MILALVDDLLFVSKIKTTARQLGVEVTFPRNSVELLSLARSTRPALVIVDLNSARFHPLDALSALKTDPSLSSVRTLGFVSHVQTDLIAAARQAGADEVVARSAFTARLGEILTSSDADRLQD